MKKILLSIFAILLVQGFAGLGLAQCTFTTSSGSATVNGGSALLTISNCSFPGTFSTISLVTAGQTLRFTSSDAADFVTIHSGTPNGPVIAFGQTPLTFTNTFTGTIYAHWSSNATCATVGSCRITQVQCTSCTVPAAIVCPQSIQSNNSPGYCEAVVTYTTPTVSAGAVLTQTGGLPSGAFFPVGTTTNTFLATAPNGSTATCSFNVTVIDNQPPTISCNVQGAPNGPNGNNLNPEDVTLTNDPNVCGALFTYDFEANDNCGAYTVTQTAGLASESTFPVGTTANTFVATDGSGNTASCSFNVEVVDIEAPIASCINVSAELDFQSVAIVTAAEIDNGSFDNCGVANIALDTGLFSCNEVGSNTVFLTVTDVSGNTSSCNAVVTVYDNEPPTVSCNPGGGSIDPNTGLPFGGNDQISNDPGICGALYNYLIETGDNCVSTSSTLIAGLPPFSVFPIGTTTNTVLVTDASGNTATCTFDLTVLDTEAPVITCPPNAVVTEYVFSPPTATDNCAIASLVQTGGLPSGSFAASGLVTNTFVATDESGNTASCSFNLLMQVDEPCSNQAFPLQRIDSSFIVNICVAGNFFNQQIVPCDTGQLPWGSVYNQSSGADFDIEVILAPGWVADYVTYSLSPFNYLSYGWQGFPNSASDWFSEILNPTRTQFSIQQLGVLSSCNIFAMRISLFRIDMFGGEIPGTEIEAWVYNPGWNNPNSLNYNGRSPYFFEICPQTLIADTIALACSQTIIGNNGCGSIFPGGNCIGAPNDEGRWYEFIGTGRYVLLSTCNPGTNFDTQLSVYTGADSNLTCIGGNDNAQFCSNPFASEFGFTSQVGERYAIFVSGANGATGQFELSIKADAVANDDVCNAVPLQAGVALAFDNRCATTEANEPSAPGGDCNTQNTWCDAVIDNTVWFSFQAPATGCVSLLIDNMQGFDSSTPNFQLAVWEGPSCNAFSNFELLAANDDGGPDYAPVITAINCLIPGQTYYVQVDGYDGFQGSGDITLNECTGNPALPAFTTVPAAVNNIVDVCLGQSIYFQDQSAGVTSWLWEFGDGYISSLSSPSHAYQLPGNYTVQLTVSDICGNTSTLTAAIAVSPEPAPEIFCPSIVCEGDTAIYSTNAVCTTYQWQVVGGTVVSPVLNNDSIMVVWGSGTNGVGTVSLTVPNCGALCDNPAFRVVPILPTSLTVSGPAQVCAGNAATYNVPNIPGTVYNWSVGSLGFISAGQGTNTVQIVWNQTAVGVAQIQLSYLNQLAGCAGTGAYAVEVLQRFQVTGPQTACEGVDNANNPFTAQQILGNVAVPCNWSVTTPAGAVLANLASNTATFSYDFSAGGGQYLITATPASGNYCNATASIVVNATATPATPAVITGAVLVCPDSVYHYATATSGTSLQWSVTGGNLISTIGNNVDVQWDAIGPYELSVFQLSNGSPSCSSAVRSLTVNANPPTALPTLAGQEDVCLGGTATYSFAGALEPATTYTWTIDSPQLGNIVSGQGSNNIVVQWAANGNQPTTAQVSLSVTRCGTQDVNFAVNLHAHPEPVVTGPASVCAGAAVSFGDNGQMGDSYAWSFGDGGTASSHNPTHAYATAGSYTVSLTITSAQGCTGSTTFPIVVLPIPTAPVLSGLTTVCTGATANYAFSPLLGGTSYSWNLSPALGSIAPLNANAIAVTWDNIVAPTTANVVLSLASQCLTTDVQLPVNILPLPNPVLSGSSSLCVGGTAQFTDNGTGTDTYFWTFGDGGVSTAHNPTHVYNVPGNYTVTLTLTNAQQCTGTGTWNIAVNAPPTPVITGPATACAGATVSFTDNGTPGDQYAWTFGDGGTATVHNPSHVYTTAGNYTVDLQLTDANGCTASTSFAIVVNAVPAMPVLAGQTAVCSWTATSYSFSPASSVTTYSWATDPITAASSTPSVNANPAIFAWNPVSSPASVDIVLHYTSTCSTGDVRYPVTVNPIPSPTIGGSDTVCPGVLAQFTDNAVSGESVNWSFGDGGTSTIHDPQHSYALAGDYVVTLVLTNAQGCIATSTFPVHVKSAPATPVVAGPQAVCSGMSANYSYGPASSSSTYVWSVSPGAAATSISNPGGNPVNITWQPVATPTTVNLILTMLSACDTLTVSYPVTVNPLPTAQTIASTAICAGTSIAIGAAAVAGSTYAWTPAIGLSAATAANPIAAPASTTTYTLTETITATGCTNAQAVTISVNPLPIANTGPAQTICSGTFATLGAAAVPGNTYSWSPTAGLSDATVANPTADPTSTTLYTLTEINTATTCQRSNTVTVTVRPSPTPLIGFNSPVCLGIASSFTVSGGASWLWNFGDGGTSTVQNPSHTFATIGTQTVTVTVTNADGCSAATSQLVNINPVPVAVIHPLQSPTVCIGDTISVGLQQDFIGSGYSFSWQPGGFSTTNPTTVTNTGSYNLIVTNSFGCSAASNTVSVTTRDCTPCLCGTPGCADCPCDCGTPGCAPCGDACIIQPYTLDFNSMMDGCSTSVFSSMVSNVSNLNWSFGDGGTSALPNPTHTYAQPGNYTVRLSGIVYGTLWLGGGICSTEVAIEHVVTTPLIANFFTEFQCNGAGQIETQFKDNSLFLVGNAINNWTWDFGDGSPLASGLNTSHVYATPGLYNATLTIGSSVSGATCAITLPVNVPTPAVAAFTQPSTVCQASLVAFTNTSTGNITSYLWDFDVADGMSATSNLANPTAVYNAAGSFTASLSVTDAYGCSSSGSQPINILPLNIDTIAGGPLRFCQGDSVTLTAPAGTAWIWSPGNATTQSIVATQSGSYSVIVAQANGCSYTTAVVEVTANPIPIVQAGNAVSICRGNSVQIGSNGTAGNVYAWTPHLTLSASTVSNPVANPTATTIYTLTQTDSRTGCSASQAVTVTVNAKPLAQVGGNQSICVSGSVQLGAAAVPGNTYLWSPAAGLSSATVANPIASPSATTVYTLTETVTATGCQGSNNVTVSVNALPAATTGGNETLCSGGSVQIGGGAIAGNSYVWSPVAGLNSATVANPVATPTVTTTYTLTETVGGTGCQRSNAVTVTVHPMPAAIAGADATICVGSSVQLGAAPVAGSTYAWSPTTGLSAANIANPIASPTSTKTYLLTETVTATGCQRSSSVTVTVNPLPVGNAGNTIAICSGGSAAIGTAPVSGNTYAWTPTIGLSSATIANPLANPIVTTTYTLTETVLATGCQRISSVTVTVNPRPVANAGPNLAICLGSGASLGAPAVLGNNYVWSPATGLSASNIAQPIASPSTTTTYQLTETVTATGCQATQAVTVTVQPLPFAAAGNDVTVCAGISTPLGSAGISGHGYAWTPAAGLSASNVADPVAAPTGTTTYTLVETDLLTGCQNTHAVTVTVQPLPTAFVGNNVAICAGGSVLLGGANTSGNTYAWSPSTGLSSATISNPTAAPTATTAYTLTETNTATGCSNSHTVTVTVNPLPGAFAGNDMRRCFGDTATLGAVPVPGNTYLWSPGIGLSATTIANPQAWPSVTTTYSLTETVTATGCSATNQVQVTVRPSPPANITGTSVYCSGETLHLQTDPGWEYSWYFDQLPIDGGYSYFGVSADSVEFVVDESHAGNYQVLVNDPQTGCTNWSAPFAVTVNPTPDAPVISVNGAGPLCSSQTWTLSVDNVVSGVNYVWSTGQVGTSIVAVGAGTYTVTAVNGFGCGTASNAIVIHPSPNLAAIPSGCYNYCETLAPLEVVGPTGFAQYAWLQAPGQTLVGTQQNLSVSTSGSYQLQVTNAEGCSATSDPLDITFIDCCTTFVASTVTTDVSCFGGNDGTAAVAATGGLEPYVYQWNTGETTTLIHNISAGEYIVQVTDHNNCVLTATDTVNEPTELVITVNEGSILCQGGLATVVVSASGGTPPYSGIGVQTLPAGPYFILVTDANGCEAEYGGFLAEPDALTASVTADPIQCQGELTLAAVTAVGGTEPYIGTGLFPVSNGTHVFVVTDANGCTTTTTLVMAPVSTLEAIASVGSILCHGDSTTVMISAVGGNPPYAGLGSYVVGAGAHTFLVGDANLCTDTILVVVDEPATLLANASATSIACAGGNATVTVTASGGTAPYVGVGTFTVTAGTYSYVVTDANDCSTTVNITVDEPASLLANASATSIACAGGNATVTVTASGGAGPYIGIGTFSVTAGTYNYVVTDANDCSATVNIVVTQPTPLVASAIAGTIACAGGSTNVVVTASGGTSPYTGVGTFIAAAGSHSYLVTDANGCTATVNIVVTQPTPLVASATAGTIACAGGSTNVVVTASGGTAPYTGVGTFIATAGSRSYLVTDANGCTATVNIVVLTSPDITPPSITCPANITAAASTGQCSAAVNYTVTASDNCGAANVVVNPASGSVFAVGTATVTATATDIAGNIATCSFTVTMTGTGGGVTWTGVPANLTIACGTPIPDAPVIVPCSTVSVCPPVAVCYPNFTHLGDYNGSRYYRSDVAGSWTQSLGYAQGIGGTLATIDNVGENTYLNNLIGGATPFWIGLNDATTEGTYAWASGSSASYRNWATGQPDNAGNQDYATWNSNTGKWDDRGAADSYKGLVEINCGGVTGVSATNACGPCPTVTMAQTTVAGNCAGRYTIVRTWTAASTTGVVLGTTTQTITVTDNVAPVVTCPANISVSAGPGATNAVVNYTVTATDNCSGATVTSVPASGSVFALGTTVVVATATDGCGNSSTCTFNVTVFTPLTVVTTTSNVTCYQGTNGTATATATGGIAPYTYQWSTNPVQTGATATGLAAGTYTVTVTDAMGNAATRTVTLGTSTCTGFRTQTQGGWGAPPQGNNPASYLYARFASTFPTGLTVGCTKTLRLTSKTAVTNFLPSGGTPAALTANLVNPTTYANTLAGQVVALKLSIGFDNADPNFSSSSTPLQNLVIGSGTFAGWTVAQLLTEGEKKLGGCPSSYTASALSAAIDLVNQNYDNGTVNGGYLYCPCSVAKMADPGGEAESAGDAASLRAYPNPTQGMLEVVLSCKSCAADGKQVLRLTDLTGKVLQEFSLEVVNGEGHVLLDLSRYASATYLLSLEGDGVGRLVQRVVKQ